MKKVVLLMVACLLMMAMLAGCGKTTEDVANADQVEAEASGLTIHKIGVATYNVQDAQVMMFKDYLDNYVKECFTDVTFLYSESIGSEDDMMAFLQTCADNDVEGVMFFYSGDFQKEVEFCADHEMYCIRPSGNASDEEFQKVADNPYFLGEIGPGNELEYTESEKLTQAMSGYGDGYVILSGGAFMGNVMHMARAMAFIDTLEQIYGVELGDSKELALTPERLDLSEGSLKVSICPGYIEIPEFGDAAREAILSGEYTTILGTIPVTSLMDVLTQTEIHSGVVDCFSEDNYFGFKKDKLGYVAGKYQSEIGPAFAALYNALTGNADLYREDGKAFRLVQGYWTAADTTEYDSMYALASGAAVNAYNYEDLYSCVKSLNPDANFADFKALVEAYSYDDCLARRTR